MPPQLVVASVQQPIDVGRALHMLGTLTMPNMFSPASPALFWAWLRYYRALTGASDLRITMDFSDLDPHQKGILSDDFGVALSTQWLVDRLGPFTHIVDGRRFANQFTRLLRKRHKSKAKIGTSKSPDFVMRDTLGKWHVLECKGTQSNRKYQSSVLKTALAQKRAIQLIGSIRGEQLASSLYIAHEKERLGSSLRVIDPEEDEPLIRLTEQESEEMEAKASRLAVAQALGAIGLNEVAVEMSLPQDIDPKSELLFPSERSRLRSSRRARVDRATEQARGREFDSFTHGHRRYKGRVIELELPPPTEQVPYRKVRIRQGVLPEIIEELISADSFLDHRVDDQIRPHTSEARIAVEAARDHTAVTYGDVFYSELNWIK